MHLLARGLPAAARPIPMPPIRAIDAGPRARSSGAYGQNPSEARRTDRRRSIAPRPDRADRGFRGDGSAPAVRAPRFGSSRSGLRPAGDGRADADGGRRRHRLRRPPVASDGRDHPRPLRFRRQPMSTASKNPVGGRAHGDRRGRRLRPRHAGAGLRHRPALFLLPYKQTPVGRADRRIHALHAVGPRAEGRPRDPQRRRMHAAVALRHHDPHSDPRGALPVGRRGALRRADRALRPATW